MTVQAIQYGRRGLLAVLPQALHELFTPQAGLGIVELLASAAPAPVNMSDDGIAIVDVRGPLESGPSDWWDTYDNVLARVTCAYDAPGVRAVILRIQSPGGDAHGCFDTARALRALAVSRDIPLLAYVEERACSAAYALACAAQSIYVSASSLVGSIGVLYVREDVTERNAAMGLRVAFVTSGSRKADGNPDNPLTAEELTAQQSIVDDMAVLFFDLVRELRGLEAKALDAGVFLGAAAVTRGLADEVVTLTGLRARITEGLLDMSAYDTARKALEEAAAEDGPEAAKAKRALAAMEDEPEPDAEGDDADPPAAEGDDADPPAAEGDDTEDKKDKDPPPAAKATKAAATDAGALALAEVRKLTAAYAKDRERVERATIFASRPDWSAEQRKRYAKHNTATLRALAAEVPKAQRGASAKDALAAAGARPTAGKGQVTRTATDGGPVNSLSARMGLTKRGTGIVASDTKLTLGADVDASEESANG